MQQKNLIDSRRISYTHINRRGVVTENPSKYDIHYAILLNFVIIFTWISSKTWFLYDSNVDGFNETTSDLIFGVWMWLWT